MLVILIICGWQAENLLLTKDAHIKIADFGSVKPMQYSQITALPNAASGVIKLGLQILSVSAFSSQHASAAAFTIRHAFVSDSVSARP